MKKIITFAVFFTLIFSQELSEELLQTQLIPIQNEQANTQNDITRITDIQFEQEENFWETTLDHFDHANHETFLQRYWDSTTFDSPTGPVFIYTCYGGCNGIPNERRFTMNIAKKYGGRFFVLEHRYYGKSQPFKNLKNKHLRWLTSEQFLEDMASFINWAKSPEGLGINPERPWIVIGGSYPGALSAWFRIKYPHLVIGAWASSPVINAIDDFYMFDEGIYYDTQKSGQACTDAVRDVEQKVSWALKYDSKFIKKYFDAEGLTNQEFEFYIIDYLVMRGFQYGGRTKFCDEFTQLNNTREQFLYFKEHVMNGGKNAAYEYSVKGLKDYHYDIDNPTSSRQWTYQYCTQFGWLQSPSQIPGHSMRFEDLTVEYFHEWCQEIFGKGIVPEVEYTNNHYGGMNYVGTNIIFFNADEDPWKFASEMEANEGNVVISIVCDNCAHCIDLQTPSDDDPSTLIEARQEIDKVIGDWLDSYWNNKQDKQGGKYEQVINE